MSGQIAGLAEITEREEKFAIQSNIQIQAVVGAFENTLSRISASDLIGIIKPWGGTANETPTNGCLRL
jgi:hypothetical protein